MTLTIDVVYVNYNTTPMLLESVDSLVRHGGPQLGDVIVVDNASRDAERLDSLPERVRVIRAESNEGFAVAANRGAREASGRSLLFLNPDTVVLPATLAGLVEALDEADVVGARQFSDRDRALTISPLVAFETLGAATHCPCFDGETQRASLSHLRRRATILDGATPVPVGVVSGAALGIRRDVFDRLGGFDEGYFLYWEDVDLCKRAAAGGARIRYLPHVGVIHWLEQSANADRAAAERAAAAGRRRYYRSHHPGIATAWRAAVAACARRRPKHRARWAPESTALDRAFGPSGGAGKRWALEIARTPLFDLCATAFPSAPTFTIGRDWIERTHGSVLFVRVAVETAPGTWIEEQLYRATAP